MKKAFTVENILTMKKELIPLDGRWAEFIGSPERTGVWFVWGNSGNGKTSFIVQLCKELCKHGRVVFNSLEEGISLSLKNNFIRHNLNEAKGRLRVFDKISIEDLAVHIRGRKSADFYVIDSFQYTQMTYKDYISLKEANSNKLIIFTSHADGNNPSGRPAKSVMYDATLKIWVQGYKAFSKGRFIGPTGEFIIWPEGADRYWKG